MHLLHLADFFRFDCLREERKGGKAEALHLPCTLFRFSSISSVEPPSEIKPESTKFLHFDFFFFVLVVGGIFNQSVPDFSVVRPEKCFSRESIEIAAFTYF